MEIYLIAFVAVLALFYIGGPLGWFVLVTAVLYFVFETVSSNIQKSQKKMRRELDSILKHNEEMTKVKQLGLDDNMPVDSGEIDESAGVINDNTGNPTGNIESVDKPSPHSASVSPGNASAAHDLEQEEPSGQPNTRTQTDNKDEAAPAPPGNTPAERSSVKMDIASTPADELADKIESMMGE